VVHGFVSRTLERHPFADLFPVLLGKIQQLNAGTTLRFSSPDGAYANGNGARNAVEGKKYAINGIEV
jgi:hypothetical protein